MLMVFASALILAIVAVSSAHGASPSVRLIVEATYAADSVNGDSGLIHGKFPLQRSVHPFRAVTGRLMKYANDPDATLRIEAEGLALGTLYDFMENRQRLRHLRFTGAAIEGRVSLASRAAGLTCAARFAGTIATRKGGLVVGAWDYREAPHLAPFDKAMAEPGSFVAALTAIIGVVYGPDPLIAASADPNDAIARHARTALDQTAEDPMPIVECVTP